MLGILTTNDNDVIYFQHRIFLRQNGQIPPQNEENRNLFCLFHFFHGFARKAFIYEDLGDLMNICRFNIRETAFALVLFHETGTDDTGGDSHGAHTEISNTDGHDPP